MIQLKLLAFIDFLLNERGQEGQVLEQVDDSSQVDFLGVSYGHDLQLGDPLQQLAREVVDELRVVRRQRNQLIADEFSEIGRVRLAYLIRDVGPVVLVAYWHGRRPAIDREV